MLANEARGEVTLSIDGRPVKLCVTLGALAELEAAFDVVSLQELAGRLASLAASDLITVLVALTAGGGAPLSSAELARAQIAPRDATAAVARAFLLAVGDGE